MRRLAIMLLIVCSGCAPIVGADGVTRVGVSMDFRSAPPPPRIVYGYEPELYEVPGTSVYVTTDSDYDLCRYGGSWFLSYQGYWYRAQDYRGPFVAIDVRRVPRDVQWTHGHGDWHRGRGRGHDDSWHDRD